MKFLTKLNVAIAGLGFYLMNGLTAMAAQFPTPAPSPSDARGAPITGGEGVLSFVNQIATWVSYLFWALAVIFIFYAAFLYLTAGGDEEKVGKAKNVIMGAVIALVIAFVASGVPTLVGTFFGVKP